MAEQQKTLGAGALVNPYTIGDLTILASPATWPNGVAFSTTAVFSIAIKSGPGPAYPVYTVSAVAAAGGGNFTLTISLEAGTDNNAAAGTVIVQVDTSRSLDAKYVQPIVPVVKGGTGTATPSLVAGSGIGITGTWPNQTITNSGGGGGGTSNLFGAFAARPAAVVGSRYSTSDSVYEFVGVTGPAWQGLFRGQAVTLPAPVSDWTAVNGAGTTVDDSKGEITVSAPVPTDMSFNARLLVKATPLAAAYTARLLITAQFPIVVGGGGQWDSMAGLVFRDSVTGKFVTVQFGTRFDRTDLLEIRVVTWNNVNNPVANVMLFSIAAPTNFLWIQGGDDLTNRFGEFSTDGVTWVRFYSEPNTTFVTANQVGFFGQATTNGGSSPVFSFTATSWTLG